MQVRPRMRATACRAHEVEDGGRGGGGVVCAAQVVGIEGEAAQPQPGAFARGTLPAQHQPLHPQPQQPAPAAALLPVAVAVAVAVAVVRLRLRFRVTPLCRVASQRNRQLVQCRAHLPLQAAAPRPRRRGRSPRPLLRAASGQGVLVCARARGRRRRATTAGECDAQRRLKQLELRTVEPPCRAVEPLVNTPG